MMNYSTILSTRKFYDAVHNPDGVINLATAENGLMCDELLKVGLGFLFGQSRCESDDGARAVYEWAL